MRLPCGLLKPTDAAVPPMTCRLGVHVHQPNGPSPPGSGKSAVVTALFFHLERLPTETKSIIHTSTRATSPTSPAFAYVDMRAATSEFAFYRRVLAALAEEPVPEHGISTEAIRDRLHARIGGSRTGIVVAVDHVGESEGVDTDGVIDLFAGLPSNVSWLAIGRMDPGEVGLVEYTATSIRMIATSVRRSWTF